MEKYFTIVSDGSCDLPEEIVKEKEIGEVHFLVSFDGKEYKKECIYVHDRVTWLPRRNSHIINHLFFN